MNRWKSVPYKAIYRQLMSQRKDRKLLNVEFLYLNKVAVVAFFFFNLIMIFELFVSI